MYKSLAEAIADAGRALGNYDARAFAGDVDVPTAVVVTTKDRLVRPRMPIMVCLRWSEALAWRDGQPVRLADVAAVETRPPDKLNYSHQNGNPAIGIQIMKENDANVLDTLTAVKVQVDSLRENELTRHYQPIMNVRTG